jgi:hypothetical protein
MRSRILLERFTLVVLCLLAGLALFGLVAFLAIETLNWAIFHKLGERFFMLALPLLLASLFALSLLNLTLNQGILADRALAAAGELPDGRKTRALGLRLGLGLAGFIALSLVLLFLVNRSNVREKSLALEQQMRSFVAQRRQPLTRLAALVTARSQRREVVRILSHLASTTPSFRELQLIVPVRQESGVVFRLVSRWWIDREHELPSIEAWGNTYLPNRFELEYLRHATSGGTDVTPKIFVKRPRLKVFQPLKNAQNKTVAFLLSASHRLGRRDDK